MAKNESGISNTLDMVFEEKDRRLLHSAQAKAQAYALYSR